ncbi:GTP cyclohydrolase II domain-containing protein [Ditylenchus destructor]|nr:GTP cyclohydrolase II domain-containing protein [Ditylenchus destructor]
MAAEFVTPEAINFMAKYGRGLICLTLTRDRCEQLQLPPMATRNGTKHGTAFTARSRRHRRHDRHLGRRPRPHRASRGREERGGLGSGSSRDTSSAAGPGRRRAGARRPHRSRLRPDRHGRPDPGRRHLRDHERRRHDGPSAGSGDLRQGTRASLSARWRRAKAASSCHVFRDRSENLHMALTLGQWTPDQEVLVRVHEPFSAMDLLDAGRCGHSWPLPGRARRDPARGFGVAVLLNCGEDTESLLARLQPTASTEPRQTMDLRTYGVGAQILRELGVQKMKLLGSPRRMPSMTGYGLEVTGFQASERPAGHSSNC